eukprot:scaffold326_cov165-Amphora_coffeaeformis.AAC.3
MRIRKLTMRMTVVLPLLLMTMMMLCSSTKAFQSPFIGSPSSSSTATATYSSSSHSFTAKQERIRRENGSSSLHHSNTQLFFNPVQRHIVSIDPSTAMMLSPWEAKALGRIETWYRKALSIKCPFLRRRASDSLDSLEQVLRFIIIRHKSLDLPPVGWRCEGDVCAKEKHLPTAVVVERIRADWKTSNHKGYYITGKLSTELYRDDCFFDGPDPDMPVQGLRKYLNAASQLFETKTSVAELLSLTHDPETDLIKATWKMNGVLRLPWRPALPEWNGTTTYHRDKDGLIYKHTETWDLSVAQAFLKTLWPELADILWQSVSEEEREGELCTVEYP